MDRDHVDLRRYGLCIGYMVAKGCSLDFIKMAFHILLFCVLVSASFFE